MSAPQTVSSSGDYHRIRSGDGTAFSTSLGGSADYCRIQSAIAACSAAATAWLPPLPPPLRRRHGHRVHSTAASPCVRAYAHNRRRRFSNQTDRFRASPARTGFLAGGSEGTARYWRYGRWGFCVGRREKLKIPPCEQNDTRLRFRASACSGRGGWARASDT